MQQYYSFIVIGVALGSAVVLEGLQWLLVYRTSDFKRKREQMDRFNKKLETKGSGNAAPGKKNKKEKRIEETTKSITRDLHASRLKTGFMTGVLLLAVYSLMNSMFEGVPVARLPFQVPSFLWFLRRFTHFNLPGEDYSEVSFAFIYWLCQFSVRPNLQRALGWTPRPVEFGQNAFNSLFDPPTGKSF